MAQVGLDDAPRTSRTRGQPRVDIVVVQRYRPLLMRSLAALLREERWPGAVVGPVHWDEAVEECRARSCGLALIEYVAGRRDDTAGELSDLVAHLRVTAPSAGVVAFIEAEHHLREAAIVDAVRAGAVGVVRASDRSEGFLSILRAAATGESMLLTDEVSPLAARVEQRRSRTAEVTRRLGSLTDREREVLAGVSRGERNEQIAMALSISPRTVEKHIQHILQKLSIDSRVKAVSMLSEVAV